MPTGLFALASDSIDRIYGERERREIESLVSIYAPPQTRESLAKDPAILSEAELLFSGWGAPVMDDRFLSRARRLKAVFYGAGSIRGLVGEAFWNRGIRITSAYAANAVPVAEYTLAQIILCLKRAWYFARTARKAWGSEERDNLPGAFQSTVGVISLGMAGRRVCELLKALEVKVLAYSLSCSPDGARALGVELCSLEEVFQRSDVVSLHTPLLDETGQMVRGKHFLSMKRGASFINTARGAIVHEREMIEALRERVDLQAVLDVTDPEPPAPDSPLYTMTNVLLTPHIAGSLGPECRRLGRYMVEELKRYLRGEPLVWEITRERAAVLA